MNVNTCPPSFVQRLTIWSKQISMTINQLATDFGASSIDAAEDAPLDAVLDALRDAPETCVLLNNFLRWETAREDLTLVGRRVGTPTAMLLVDCAPHIHAQAILKHNAEAGLAVSREAAEEEAFDWSNQALPALEAAIPRVAHGCERPVPRVADTDRLLSLQEAAADAPLLGRGRIHAAAQHAQRAA